jgi:predicted RNase H-like HicB family nuclease
MTRYRAIVDGEPGAYGVVIPDLPGCTAMGGTVDEALADAASAAAAWAEVARADGAVIPKPQSEASVNWNYRVIRSEDGADVNYAIHECYYTEGDPVPTSWTDPVAVAAETRADLFWVLAEMTKAVAQPVLEIRDGKLVEVEPARELPDNIKKAVIRTREQSP